MPRLRRVRCLEATPRPPIPLSTAQHNSFYSLAGPVVLQYGSLESVERVPRFDFCHLPPIELILLVDLDVVLTFGSRSELPVEGGLLCPGIEGLGRVRSASVGPHTWSMLSSYPHVNNSCLVLLKRQGYSLSHDTPEELWVAQKDGFIFRADKPIEILGLVTIL